MFTETPRPTIEEMFEAMPLVSGRLRLVQDEIVRRLSMELPGMITELNQRNGWVGIRNKEIPQPSGFELAPTALNENYLNKILVGVALESTTHGVGAFKNEVQVVVYSIDEAVQIDQQVRVLWERADLIRGVLFPFLTGCVNAEGKRCWRQLQPTSVAMLPNDWADEYSGTMCMFVATQAPGNGEAWS